MVAFNVATQKPPSLPPRAPAQVRVGCFVAITCSVPNHSCDFYNADSPTDAQLVSSSRDPIGFVGSKWGLYLYVESLPTQHVDPYGNEVQHTEYPHNIPGGPGVFFTPFPSNVCSSSQIAEIGTELKDSCDCLIKADELLSLFKDEVVEYYNTTTPPPIVKQFFLENISFYKDALRKSADGCKGKPGKCRLKFCCNCSCRSDTIAYVWAPLEVNLDTCIHLCPAFFELKRPGHKKETLGHEIGRWCAGILGEDHTNETSDVNQFDAIVSMLCRDYADIAKVR